MIIAENSTALPVEASDDSSRSPRRIALIDARGNIVAVNNDWIALAEDTGAALDRVGPGINYLEVCRQGAASSEVARKARIGIQEVLKRKTSSFAMDYACHTPLTQSYFRMSVTPMTYGNARAAIAHTDITDLHTSKQKDFKLLQQFARRLIHSQEEERQRISREIHDDFGNRMAVMSLSVRQIMKQSLSGKSGSGFPELNKVLEDIDALGAALRNLSHWLHPPPLRYLGIGAALKELQEGFRKTSGIRTDVTVPADMPRLPDDIELCIFRITQECLQNVAKHAGADKVRIVLEHTPAQIRLTVADSGRGFVRSAAIRKGGLGLLSMEERALSVQGRLNIVTSPGGGTEIRLTIPVQEDWLPLRAE